MRKKRTEGGGGRPHRHNPVDQESISNLETCLRGREEVGWGGQRTDRGEMEGGYILYEAEWGRRAGATKEWRVLSHYYSRPAGASLSVLP